MICFKFWMKLSNAKRMKGAGTGTDKPGFSTYHSHMVWQPNCVKAGKARDAMLHCKKKKPNRKSIIHLFMYFIKSKQKGIWSHQKQWNYSDDPLLPNKAAATGQEHNRLVKILQHFIHFFTHWCKLLYVCACHSQSHRVILGNHRGFVSRDFILSFIRWG